MRQADALTKEYLSNNEILLMFLIILFMMGNKGYFQRI